MRIADPEMFARFARETRGTLAPDLRSWCLGTLIAQLPYSARVAQRDAAIHAAAGFLDPGLPAFQKAVELRRSMMAVRNGTRSAHPDESSMAGCLALALLFRDAVPTVHTLRQMLAEKSK